MGPIKSIDAVSLASLDVEKYHLSVVTLGYETRACYVARKLIDIPVDMKIATGFKVGHTHSYARNLEWLNQNRFNIQEVTDDQFRNCLFENAQSAVARTRDHEIVKVSVDISSMSKIRLAHVCEIFARLGETRPVQVDFWYARAKFSSPSKGEIRATTSGPVSRRFSGGFQNLSRDRAAVIGIGFEDELAAGVVWQLEASELWTFQPVSADPKYDIRAEKANRSFLSALPDDRKLRYRVEFPKDCLLNLESLVDGLRRNCRPILVPFGPKMFTLCCILVALMHEPDVIVWRVGTSPFVEPADRVPDGFVVGLRIAFGPK